MHTKINKAETNNYIWIYDHMNVWIYEYIYVTYVLQFRIDEVQIRYTTRRTTRPSAYIFFSGGGDGSSGRDGSEDKSNFQSRKGELYSVDFNVS